MDIHALKAHIDQLSRGDVDKIDSLLAKYYEQSVVALDTVFSPSIVAMPATETGHSKG